MIANEAQSVSACAMHPVNAKGRPRDHQPDTNKLVRDSHRSVPNVGRTVSVIVSYRQVQAKAVSTAQLGVYLIFLLCVTLTKMNEANFRLRESYALFSSVTSTGVPVLVKDRCLLRHTSTTKPTDQLF